MADLIQVRRDTAANWTSTDPVLEQGEMGYETDTKKLKFGDGSTAWSSLPYFGGGAGALDDLSDVVISGATTGDLLRYNGSNFVNTVLVAGDIPSLAASKITSGQIALARGGTAADLSATGGSGQYVKQTGAGSALSVGTIAAGDLPTGIDAAKIGGGSVSNTEFGYLDGVTSALQTQIDAKAATSHAHAASDITSGQLALARGGAAADLSATGPGFLKQATLGSAVTVATLVAADIPSLAASKITSGQLGLGQGGTSADLSATGGTGQFLKQASAAAPITVTQVTLSDLAAGTLSQRITLSGSYTSTANKEIFSGATSLVYNTPTGTEHRHQVNGTNVLIMTSTLITVGAGVAVTLPSGASVTSGSRQLVGTSAGVVVNTPTSTVVSLSVANPPVITAAAGALTLADATNFVLGTTTGTGIGTGITQKIGFWGATPVAQQTGPTALASSTSGASYTGVEQTMLQEAHDTARLTLALLRTIGIAA